jgi:molybdenum cofactor cytidylyltransferase
MAESAQQADVAGLVLAAGQSTRMGEPKPLLEIEGRTFLQATVETLWKGGCGSVAAVIASPDAAFAARSSGASIAQGRPDGEQIDSLRSGLAELGDEVAAVLVLPVDHPRVRPATVAAVIAAWRNEREPDAANPDAGGGPIVRPVHEGRPGHPTLFPRRVWPALRDTSLPDGARSVIEAERVLDIAVEDPGVLIDIDTPDDLERARGE